MRWTFVIPVLAMLLAPAPVRADDEADAKSAYARGRSLFKAGKYNEAVVELKKAYALKPHPALLRYMGDTYYKMNKARLAIEHYRKYLREAPEAPDRDKVEAKVKQLELIVGAREEEPASAPARAPAPAPTPAPPTAVPAPAPKVDAPTGEDREVPAALRRKALVEPTPIEQPRKRSNALAVLKWTALGVGVASLAVGIVFNRMAAAKAGELEDAARRDCPASNKDCGGNPDMNAPMVPFNEAHYNLQQSNQNYRTLSLVTMIFGGVVAGSSVVLFVLDRKKEQRPAAGSRASVAPIFGGGTWGMAGQVSF